MIPGTGPDDDVMNTPCWKCNPHAGCPRYVYELFMGQFWVMDNAELCKCVAVCVREDDAEAVAMALNIQADIQCQLIDEHQRMKDEIRDIPRTGTGTLTRRHKLRGAMDFGIELSNWISRRQIELSRQNASAVAPATLDSALPKDVVAG